jgi:hypothetical protein
MNLPAREVSPIRVGEGYSGRGVRDPGLNRIRLQVTGQDEAITGWSLGAQVEQAEL